MPDRPKSIPPPPLHDWTDDGIYRAAFLYLFDAEQREALQRAGAILASQAQSGDTTGHPVYTRLLAASEELRVTQRLLVEIAAIPDFSELTAEETEACEMAGAIARKIEDRAIEVAAWAKP